jgi:hypothetical protein
MKTLTTTWLAQIVAVAVLLTAGSASASSGLLSGNSPLGKNTLEGGYYRVSASISAETHQGCGEVSRWNAAGFFVAPNNGGPQRVVVQQQVQQAQAGVRSLAADANATAGGRATRIDFVRNELPARLGPGRTFSEAVGTDGTHVFYGNMGEAIIVRPNGTVVNGNVPANLRLNLTPTPNNPNPRPPFTIDDLTVH